NSAAENRPAAPASQAQRRTSSPSSKDTSGKKALSCEDRCGASRRRAVRPPDTCPPGPTSSQEAGPRVLASLLRKPSDTHGATERSWGRRTHSSTGSSSGPGSGSGSISSSGRGSGSCRLLENHSTSPESTVWCLLSSATRAGRFTNWNGTNGGSRETGYG